jgi:hypothetical protein
MAHALEPIDDSFFDTAPTVVPVVVELPNAPEQVWEALGSDEMWSWAPVIDQLTWLTPRPLAEGCVRRLRLAHLATLEEEFYRWEAPHRATFRVTKVSRKLFSGLAEDFVLDPLPGGGTKLTWTMAIAPTLALPGFMKPALAKGNAFGISGIKKILPPA